MKPINKTMFFVVIVFECSLVVSLRYISFFANTVSDILTLLVPSFLSCPDQNHLYLVNRHQNTKITAVL